MPRSKRSSARSRLFSLSARIAAKEANPKKSHKNLRHVVFGPEDDNCPHCIAMRNGTFSLDSILPRDDGSPPDYYSEAFLIAEAKKALDECDLQPGETIPFIRTGGILPDGTMTTSTFSVDADGQVFWTSPKQHKLVTRIPHEAA